MSCIELQHIHLLAPGEITAAGAHDLSDIQATALLAIATAGRLIGNRRGWSVTGRCADFSHKTLNALHRRELVRLGKSYRPIARLTRKGDWYARTLRTAIGKSTLSPQQGVEPCHVAN